MGSSWFAEVVTPSLTLALGFFTTTFAVSWFLDQNAERRIKHHLSRLCKYKNTQHAVLLWQSFVNGIFGEQLLSLRSFVIAVGLSVFLSIFLQIENMWSNVGCHDRYLQISTITRYLIITFFANCIIDYICLQKTRFLINKIKKITVSRRNIIWLGMTDLLANFFLFWFWFILFTGFFIYIVYYQDVRLAMNQFTPDAVLFNYHDLTNEMWNYGIFLQSTNTFSIGAFFYSTLIASAWSALFFFPVSILKNMERLEIFLSRLFISYKHGKNPFFYFGLPIATFTFFIVFIFSTLFLSLAPLIDLKPGDERGCKCSKTCSDSVTEVEANP